MKTPYTSDPIDRAAIQNEFLDMQAKLGKTVLFVSDDINEAGRSSAGYQQLSGGSWQRQIENISPSMYRH